LTSYLSDGFRPPTALARPSLPNTPDILTVITARQHIYAKRCISYDRFCLTVRLTVCHSPVSCQNDSSYDHAVFTA